jgi:hypothetical protein
VIADQTKIAALRKNRGFLLSRTVLEAEYELTRDAIAMHDLREVAFRNGIPVKRAQHEKAMNQTFPVAHFQRRCRQDAAEETS